MTYVISYYMVQTGKSAVTGIAYTDEQTDIPDATTESEALAVASARKNLHFPSGKVELRASQWVQKTKRTGAFYTWNIATFE